MILQIVAAANARKAGKAGKRVAEAFDVLKRQTPGRSIAAISTQNLATPLKAIGVTDDQLARLVEQQKQQRLIDDGRFSAELSTLIADYLQPLPRNAERFLNRFRVILLIAYGRGLLTSDPKVTAQQIGKRLVLLERRPQLGRSLAIAPEKMKIRVLVCRERSRRRERPPPLWARRPRNPPGRIQPAGLSVNPERTRNRPAGLLPRYVVNVLTRPIFSPGPAPTPSPDIRKPPSRSHRGLRR